MPGPPALIATIASSEYFTLSTGGSAYFYPKILNSNGAALASPCNADGNGSSFGHFYKNLLSTSSSLIVSNVITYCNICNYAGDSTATVSLWTSTGKYLQVPLVGPTYTTIRTDMIAKQGVIINTVSTNSLYSTIVTYGPNSPSSFIFKEGTYSTIIPQNTPSAPGHYNLSFADAVYLNCDKVGINLYFSTNYGSSGDSVDITGNGWDSINTSLIYSAPSTQISIWGDLLFTTYCSNASGTLFLNLSMCNLMPAYYYRMQYKTEIASIQQGSGLTETSNNSMACISFPGTVYDYVNISTQMDTYTSGSICLYANANYSGSNTCNLMFVTNQANSANSFQYDINAGTTSNYDIITFGSVSNTSISNYNNSGWHFITVTFSNYTVNKSNYYDFNYYYNSIKQGSSLSNVGNTSSFMGQTLVLGQYFPGFIMNVGIFDRCLCKREIELYSDIVFSGVGAGSGTGTGTGTGGGGGGSSNYTSAGTYTFTVPSGVSLITITLNGAGGANGSGTGAKGGLVVGTLSVSSSQPIDIIVGGTSSSYGGGGSPGTSGGQGGGGTSVSFSGTLLAIAGGGGGGGSSVTGGDGGSSTGGTGGSSSGTAATGGTLTGGGAGGSSGGSGGAGGYLTGGNARTSGKGNPGGGGGGGGYYGGGGGGSIYQAGAGGSSYTSGLTSVTTDTQGGGSGHGTDGSVTIAW